MVKREPSPTNLAKIVDAKIEVVEILDAVMKLVLNVLALMNAGIEKELPPPPGTLVN